MLSGKYAHPAGRTSAAGQRPESPHQSGKARLARLIQLLENEGSIADILEVVKNAAVRNRLYKKYGL